VYWSLPNFLAAVFKKQEISQQVVTRMQDLASEYSQIFWGLYPRNLTAGGGRPPPAPNTQPGLLYTGREAQAPRCWGPNLGPPQLFSRGCAPVGGSNSQCISAWIKVDIPLSDISPDVKYLNVKNLTNPISNPNANPYPNSNTNFHYKLLSWASCLCTRISAAFVKQDRQ